jgi:hypothetical protein
MDYSEDISDNNIEKAVSGNLHNTRAPAGGRSFPPPLCATGENYTYGSSQYNSQNPPPLIADKETSNNTAADILGAYEPANANVVFEVVDEKHAHGYGAQQHHGFTVLSDYRHRSTTNPYDRYPQQYYDQNAHAYQQHQQNMIYSAEHHNHSQHFYDQQRYQQQLAALAAQHYYNGGNLQIALCVKCARCFVIFKNRALHTFENFQFSFSHFFC